ncbi:MAG: CinA family protein [Candidatus Competibacteraceae bacterium]|nr:CinA family protein [Candidatus Competibacteraceae bacterium]
MGKALQLRGWMAATAESCTGGGIAMALTELAGSSAWFDRGFVTYSNAAKSELLGVEPALIESSGAVSSEVVKAMAEGALARSGAGVSVAVSGIAGPEGGSELKPVGTIWIAWATRDGPVLSECFRFEGDRQQIRQQAVMAALKGLLHASGGA